MAFFQKLITSVRTRQTILVLIPLIVSCTGYCFTLKNTGLPVNLPGIFDAIAFAIALYLLFQAIARIRYSVVSYLLIIAVSLLASTVVIGNVLYFKVFHDFLHISLLEQWSVGSSIIGGLLKSIKFKDVALLVIIPIILVICFAVVVKRSKQKFKPTKSLAALILFLILHFFTASKAINPAESNLFLMLARELVLIPFNGKIGEVTFNDKWDFYPKPDNVYYKETIDNDYPLIRQPNKEKGEMGGIFGDSTQPNIVLILMESVRAAESGAYGAKQSFTPCFDTLAQKGLLFKNFYANGSQTVRGEFSLLCSFYPNFSGPPIYMKCPDLKIATLPGILRDHGYTTMWISGFRANYANKSGFLLTHGIDTMYDGSELPESTERIGWGLSDKEIFKYAEQILDTTQGPFFAEIMTLSNHWPFSYDYEVEPPTPAQTQNTEYKNYCRGIYYTDWAVGEFLKRMEKKSYFKNTLFIITSDHGIWYFAPEKNLKTVEKQEAYFRMPFLLYAPHVVQPGISDILCSQVDLAPTILDMLGIYAENSFVGQSMLDSITAIPRFVLMQHLQRWNLRTDDWYIYCAGEESFVEHVPLPPKGTKFERKDFHVKFKVDNDLLTCSRDQVFQFDSIVAPHIVWTMNLIKKNQHLTFSNRIFNKAYHYNR